MRPTLSVALALGLSCTACSPVTSRLSDAKPEAGPDYFYADVTKGKGRTIERLSDPALIIARYGHTNRRTIYLTQDGGVADIPRFDFKVVDKATVKVELSRISDVGGSGIDKGAVRRETTITREFPKAEVHKAVEMLQGLATSPVATLKAQAPDEWETVGHTTQIDPQEAGFAIGIEAQLQTGNPLDPNDRITLYQLQTRSPYQQTEDGPAEAPAGDAPQDAAPAPDPDAPKPTSSPS